MITTRAFSIAPPPAKLKYCKGLKGLSILINKCIILYKRNTMSYNDEVNHHLILRGYMELKKLYMKKLKNVRKHAFTLAEVLVTLGIIGVVAALTMPTLMANHQKAVQKAQFKKAYSLFSNAVFQAQAQMGYPAYCSYWDGARACSTKCTKYNSYNECISWTCADGSPLPARYNGPRENCDKFEEELFTKTLKTVKFCQNKALENGCITSAYKGVDQVKSEQNPDSETGFNPDSGYGSNNIKNKYSAWILDNGMVIIKYGTYKSNFPIYTIDINGHKKPNKWGHDLFTFQLQGNNDGISKVAPSTYAIEKGGKSTEAMMKE